MPGNVKGRHEAVEILAVGKGVCIFSDLVGLNMPVAVLMPVF